MAKLPTLDSESIDHGHILLIDDDPEIRLLVSRFLRRSGYQTSSLPDGQTIMDKLSKYPIDLIILDLMMPGKNGIDLCREVRVNSRVPIIMLTARGDENDRIVGLEVGADDYVTKPFSSGELLARVRAVLRRVREKSDPMQSSVHDCIEFDGWTLDLRRRELTAPKGVLVDLSTGEFDLLVVFIEHANRVLSREALMEFAKLRTTDEFDRTIDVQVSRLRKKLAFGDPDGLLIKTVRGAGYVFSPKVVRNSSG